ncbi:MAG TPA: LUD domain-containing protein [Tepidisphaeraceae bacterium]|jgi:L-lactate utilization protein LutC|nr:LUD domain-containing protein [Tepidisphaeraceae bacterium]
MSNVVIENIRKALGRTEALTVAPVPPVVDETVARLVYAEVGLPDLFARQARASAMSVDMVSVDELHDKLEAYLRGVGCKKICLPATKLIRSLDLVNVLRQRGFEARGWDELTADQTYDYDCGVTDAYAAVAETGSIVMRASAEHGRVLSLTPPIHVAILEPKVFVADLVDLFEKVTRDGAGSGVTLITGPSKTSDIEGQLVTGVHGPGKVHVFVLQ